MVLTEADSDMVTNQIVFEFLVSADNFDASEVVYRVTDHQQWHQVAKGLARPPSAVLIVLKEA